MKNGLSNRAAPLDPEFAALFEQLSHAEAVAPIDAGMAKLIARISTPSFRLEAGRRR